MYNRLLAILTYNVPHRKTFDTLSLLKAKGYENITVFAQPMTYTKKRQPLVAHRPELNYSIPHPVEMCQNLGYQYLEGEFSDIVGKEWDEAVFLLCGAGLLPDEFVRSHRIINSHPGYIPYARGLDSYKWSVYKKLPIGVSTHLIGEYVDAGEIIDRRTVEIKPYDSFHSVAIRVYEYEIEMLVEAIEKVDEEHDVIVPPPDSELFKRMPESMEVELFHRFDEYPK